MDPNFTKSQTERINTILAENFRIYSIPGFIEQQLISEYTVHKEYDKIL